MSALNQPLDMGIPKPRARAALKRTKDDVMSAAERIFAGEFDDVPSDKEEDGSEADRDNCEAEGSGSRIEVDYGDEENEIESLGGNDDFGNDAHDGVDNSMADPYANVFFSKDRTEVIIEPLPDMQAVDEINILSRAEWMRGCPEGNEQSYLFQHYNYLESGELSCPGGCGKLYTRGRADFFALMSDFATYEQHLEAKVSMTCPKCAQTVCLACGEVVRASSPGKGVHIRTNREQKLLHCPNLQGVLVGMGLYMIDKTSCGYGSIDSHSSTSNTPPHKRLRPPSETSSGATTPMNVNNGTGYAGGRGEDMSGQKAAIEAQTKADLATTEVLRQVEAYLPNLDRPGGACISDLIVHPTALAHLRRKSTFVNDLLRNESLLDMTNREELYAALFDWLKLVSNHESLASMLAMPQMRPVKSEVDPKDPSCRFVTYEGASSSRELLEVCVIQAKAALKSLNETRPAGLCEGDMKEKLRQEALQRTKEEQEEALRAEAEWDETNAKDDQLKAFCQRIVDTANSIDRSLAEVKGRAFVEKMRDNLPNIPDLGDHVIQTKQTGSSSEAVKKIYEDWATKARFQYCDLSSGEGYRHRYDSNLKINSSAGTSHRGRVRAIAQEMGMLSMSLPVSWDSSIFVRVDSSRPDCLKAMIIGPRGTPYENGCFIFDIYLPGHYNNVAPLVSSMTTNGGKYRYNPNLYAEGKVCLSLLGTWAGPGWIAGKSTLLQVLISIQSLILCDEPYLNEPSWANSSGSAQSKSYSANVRRMVIMDAMANNIEKPPFPFENEIKSTFRLKKDEIFLQLDAWKEIDDGHQITGVEHFSGHSKAAPAGPSRSPFDVGADRLRSLLDTIEIEL